MGLKFLLDAPSVPRYPGAGYRIPDHGPAAAERKEACMGAKRYGLPDGKGPVEPTAYHQSRDELAGLPQTTAEKVPVTSTPNIFSYRAYVFAKTPALVQRYIKATKADVGGVGGHVVAAAEAKSGIAQ